MGRKLAVAGDTSADVESGLRAGAAVVAGAPTSTGSRAQLEHAGAPLILETIEGILPPRYRVTDTGGLGLASGRRPARWLGCALTTYLRSCRAAERHKRGWHDESAGRMAAAGGNP
jgi:hypothetical protein